MRAVILPLAAVAVIGGCTVTGSFSGLDAGKTTAEQVTAMLGEANATKEEKGQSTWQYQFVKLGKNNALETGTVLDLELRLSDSVLQSYDLSVSEEKVTIPAPPPRVAMRPVPRDVPPNVPQDTVRDARPVLSRDAPRDAPPTAEGPPRRPRTGSIIEDFDKDGDGKVAKAEFDGPDGLFSNLDANNDGFIDGDEAKPPPPPPRR